MGESSYVVNAKPGKNNVIFIAGRFDSGHWEFWVNFMHFLVAAQSWPARASCSSSGRADRPWGQAAWGVTERTGRAGHPDHLAPGFCVSAGCALFSSLSLKVLSFFHSLPSFLPPLFLSKTLRPIIIVKFITMTIDQANEENIRYVKYYQ